MFYPVHSRSIQRQNDEPEGKTEERFEAKLFPKCYLKQNKADRLLLSVLQYYPLEEVLAAEYLLEDFRPDLIQMVLDKLRPEHVRSV